jgi:hypothetical protein
MDARRAVSCGNALVSSLHRLLRDEGVARSETPIGVCHDGSGVLFDLMDGRL